MPVTAVVAIVKRFPIWTGIGLFALFGFLFRDFVSGGVGDLKVGDCFDVSVTAPDGTVVKDVQHHPCSDLHVAEMLLITSMIGTDYPGVAIIEEFAKTKCVPAFQTYTGRDFDSDETYDMGYLRPTTDGWKKGDREVKCYAVRIDGQPSKGSVRASR